jgi:predicted ester cyclase
LDPTQVEMVTADCIVLPLGWSLRHSLSSMLENENTALVRRWFEEVWNRRQLSTIDELLAPEAVAHDLGGSGASTKGPGEFKIAAEQLLATFGRTHFVVEDIFGVEDRVAVRLTAHLKNTGPLGDLPATGAEVSVPIMCIVHVRDGKLVEGWNSWDVITALRAANAPPERTTMF